MKLQVEIHPAELLEQLTPHNINYLLSGLGVEALASVFYLYFSKNATGKLYSQSLSEKLQNELIHTYSEDDLCDMRDAVKHLFEIVEGAAKGD